jgi:hypothetical protein
MARSSYVYLVTLNTRPIAAFTVKHELESYLDKERPRCPTNLRVARLRDGWWKG